MSYSILTITKDRPVTVNDSCADVFIRSIVVENRFFFSSVRSFLSSFFCWQLIVVFIVAVISKLYTARWKKQLSIKHVIPR